MKIPQPLPCRLHPNSKVTVRLLASHPDFKDQWVVSCSDAFCDRLGVSRRHAVTRWNEAQKEEGAK